MDHISKEKNNYCFLHEVCFDIGNDARQRVAIFSKVVDGEVEKMVCSLLPINKGETYWKKPTDEAWQELILKVKPELEDIKFFLLRDSSINPWTVNKSVWDDVTWCNNIGEIPQAEENREISLKKMKELDEIFSFGVKNKRGDSALACIATLTEVLIKVGLPEIKIV
ncbi:hypothetical protein LJC17_03160 [Acholeplasma sp. OttesenSCG-928-E16]|nr:hypothetical protein [Acholeplasma sp. OttesenSCG-928-E16]